MRGTLFTQIIFIGVLSLLLGFINPPAAMIDPLFSKASAQSTAENTVNASTQHNETQTQSGEVAIGVLQDLVSTLKDPTGALDAKMVQISTSNNPADIATLAYIWGFPLVSMERQFNFVTNPNVPPA